MKAIFATMIIALPIADVISLAAVGRRIGVWPVVALVLASGLCGAILVRLQGVVLVAQTRAAFREGRAPAREVFDGACILLGGALLIIPGFVSDVLGLALLTPPVRSLLRAWLGRSIVRADGGGWTDRDAEPAGSRNRPGSGPVIEGEFETVPTGGSETRYGPDRPAAGTPAANGSPWSRKGQVVPPDDPC